MAITVRRDNISGKRTPDGVLTRVSETARGRIVKESEAIDAIASKAGRGGKNHDVTLSLGPGGAGLTVHCNDEPISVAGPRLEAHCAIRKYIGKVSNWYGVCVWPSDISLRFGINLDYKWRKSAVWTPPLMIF
jgi:hypothetical protein